MANQIIVTDSGNVQVSITPTNNVQVEISRAAITTLTTVGNANYANVAGTVANSSQPNITSLGTLVNLTSAGNITAPFFIGNVIGNVSGNIVVPGTNTSVLYNNAGVAGASDAFQFNQASNTVTITGNLSATNISGNGAGLSAITGANVTGQVGYAGVANSVSGSNVSGAVAYATTANAVAGANVSGQVAYAAVANSVAGANVSGAVAYATTANSVAGANVSGQVSYAAVANSVSVGNVSGIGNISTINIDGNLGNVLYGNGVFAAVIAPTSVANANYANFAGTAFSVSGSNVSGTVANAIYADNAGNATIANSANSVAVANVSGIGNIATTNYDGNASNVLYGNGGFYALPTISNVANANFANYAGNVTVNSQPNITSVGTLISLDVTGNVSANAYQLTTSPGTLTPATGQMVWDTASNTVSLGMLNGVTQQIGLESYVLVKASATITDGQVVMFTGANGNHVQAAPADTTSVGFRPEYIIGVATQSIATNDFGYITVFGIVHGLNTNSFNVGDILWVDNSTPGALTATRPTDPNFQIEVAAVTKKSSGDGHLQVRVTAFNSINELTDVTITTPTAGQALVYNASNLWVNGVPAYANTANSVAVANVSGIGNIATINLDGSSSNVLYGNGVFAPESTTIATANFANYAGNVINATQSNITTVGNLLQLNISNSVANTRSPTTQFIPSGANVGNVGSPLSAMVFTDYGSQASNVNPMNWAFVKYRGNISTPSAVANGDSAMRISTHVYNGNTTPRATLITSTAPFAANASFQYSNVAWTPGAFNVITGNPNGNVYSTTATSPQNALSFDQYGRLNMTQASQGSGSGYSIGITSYGANSDGSGAGAGFVINRARGNRDSNSAVGTGDSLGGLQFTPYNGSGFVESASVTSVVNTTYGTIVAGQRVPTDVKVVSGSNTTAYTTTFQGDGNVNFPGLITSTNANLGNLTVSNYFSGNGSLLTDINGANVSGDVAGANHANISDVANSVAGANVSGEVAYAAVANSVAVANVSGIGNIATINLDGSSSNVLYGNGVFAPESQTGNANFASYAGNVTVAAQSNITSLGNLTSLVIADSNVSNPITQFIPTGNVIGTATFGNTMLRIDNYTDLGNANSVQNVSFVKSRGNATTPAATANNDVSMRVASYVYNGNGYPKVGQMQFVATQAANANLQLANTAWTAGAFTVQVGNPYGNVANASSNTNQNQLSYNQNGTLVLLAGTNTNGVSAPAINVINYGIAANGVGSTQPWLSQRARGNRDSNVAVATGDSLGIIGWQGYNGNAFFSTRFASIAANVNTAHGAIANGASIPTDLNFVTCSNTTAYTTTLYGNGSANFPGLVSATGNVSGGNLTTAGNISGNNISLTNGITAGNSISITLNNISTVNPSFAFSTYNNANSLVNPYTFYRARGNVSTPAAAQVGDSVSSIGYNIYGDSGNTYLSVATSSVNVLTNDGAGNVSGDYSINASKITLIGNVYPTNVVLNKFNETVSNPGAVSGTITPDLANGTIFKYTLTGSITLNSLANVATGSSATIVLTQGGSGSYTLTSSMLFAGAAKTLSTAVGAVDIISVFYDGSTYYASLTKGYA